MNRWISRNIILRPVYRFRSEPVLRLLNEVRAFNRLEPDRMKQIQSEKLQTLISFLDQHNSYYHSQFQTHSIDVSKPISSDDLARLPIHDKKSLRSLSDKITSDTDLKYSARKTSGSSGTPFRFSKDRIASAYMDAVMYDAYGWHGIRIGDRQARLWGLPLDLKGRYFTVLKDIMLNRRRLSSFDLSMETVGDYFKTLLSFKPAFLYGLVNAVCEFGRLAKEVGYDPADLGLKAVITTGEMLFPHQRAFLNDSFKTRIVNEYGCSECGIIAFECEKGSLHIMNYNLIAEIVKQGTNEIAPPDTIGELVITELHARKYPFIRYRNGDMASLSQQSCGCGLHSPVLKSVEGRVSDLIVLPDGRKVAPTLLAYSMPVYVRKFKGIQDKQFNLKIRLVVDQESCPPDDSLLLKELKTEFGESISITVERVEDIPVEKTGKQSYFQSVI